jgi:hypothetical protein
MKTRFVIFLAAIVFAAQPITLQAQMRAVIAKPVVTATLAPSLPYGTYYIKSAAARYFIDGTAGYPNTRLEDGRIAPSGAFADGTRILMWEIAESYVNQKWIIQSDGAGNYYFKNAASGKAMDASYRERNNNGCPIICWQTNGGETQKWRISILPNGKYTIRLASNNKAVTMSEASPGNGTALQLWDYSNTRTDQQWELQRVVERTQTPWLYGYKKRGTGGDNEFFGHGPQVNLDVRLVIRNNNEIWAITDFNAKEPGDATEAAAHNESMIYKGNTGEVIEYIYSRNGSYVRYTDGDHEEDFVLPADKGEHRPQADLNPAHNWQLPNTDYRECVKFVRFMGDRNGHDFNNAPPGLDGGCGFQVFFNDIRVAVKNTSMSSARIVNVPESFYGCGESTCSASSGSGFLNFYGIPVSCEEVWRQCNSVTHVTNALRALNIANLGVDPNTLKDILNRNKTGFQLLQINQGPVALARIRANIRINKPTIILVSWGSKAVRDSYCPGYDSYGGGSAAIHYVVVRGMDEPRKLFYILDNGEPKTWTQDYMLNAIYWRPENFVIEGGLYGAGVRPGSIIF